MSYCDIWFPPAAAVTTTIAWTLLFHSYHTAVSLPLLSWSNCKKVFRKVFVFHPSRLPSMAKNGRAWINNQQKTVTLFQHHTKLLRCLLNWSKNYYCRVFSLVSTFGLKIRKYRQAHYTANLPFWTCPFTGNTHYCTCMGEVCRGVFLF